MNICVGRKSMARIIVTAIVLSLFGLGTAIAQDSCATNPVDVIIPGDNGRLAIQTRWQLIPPWWRQSLKELPATFNARAVPGRASGLGSCCRDDPALRDDQKGGRRIR